MFVLAFSLLANFDAHSLVPWTFNPFLPFSLASLRRLASPHRRALEIVMLCGGERMGHTSGQSVHCTLVESIPGRTVQVQTNK